MSLICVLRPRPRFNLQDQCLTSLINCSFAGRKLSHSKTKKPSEVSQCRRTDEVAPRKEDRRRRRWSAAVVWRNALLSRDPPARPRNASPESALVMSGASGRCGQHEFTRAPSTRAHNARLYLCSFCAIPSPSRTVSLSLSLSLPITPFWMM